MERRFPSFISESKKVTIQSKTENLGALKNILHFAMATFYSYKQRKGITVQSMYN